MGIDITLSYVFHINELRFNLRFLLGSVGDILSRYFPGKNWASLPCILTGEKEWTLFHNLALIYWCLAHDFYVSWSQMVKYFGYDPRHRQAETYENIWISLACWRDSCNFPWCLPRWYRIHQFLPVLSWLFNALIGERMTLSSIVILKHMPLVECLKSMLIHNLEGTGNSSGGSENSFWVLHTEDAFRMCLACSGQEHLIGSQPGKLWSHFLVNLERCLQVRMSVRLADWRGNR